MGPMIAVRRTRKFRTDSLVHLAVYLQRRHTNRHYQIRCTNYWVAAQQVEEVDAAPNCLACLSRPEKEP